MGVVVTSIMWVHLLSDKTGLSDNHDKIIGEFHRSFMHENALNPILFPTLRLVNLAIYSLPVWNLEFSGSIEAKFQLDTLLFLKIFQSIKLVFIIWFLNKISSSNIFQNRIISQTANKQKHINTKSLLPQNIIHFHFTFFQSRVVFCCISQNRQNVASHLHSNKMREKIQYKQKGSIDNK